jgi:hypothetical protein
MTVYHLINTALQRGEYGPRRIGNALNGFRIQLSFVPPRFSAVIVDAKAETV